MHSDLRITLSWPRPYCSRARTHARMHARSRPVGGVLGATTDDATPAAAGAERYHNL